jgi:FkbM family methyltransferase
MLIDFRTLFPKYGIKDCKRILHVGAHSGEEAQVYQEIGANHVSWIEANPSLFTRLQNHIQQYPGQYAINACVSDEDNKEVTFKITNNDGQSSSFLELGTHKVMHPDCVVTSEIKLKTITIATLFNEGKLPTAIPFDMLTADVQGAELLVLKGMGDHLRLFKYLYLEVNSDKVYENCGLISDIDFYVGAYGFQRVETKWASANLTWGDALYVKG